MHMSGLLVSRSSKLWYATVPFAFQLLLTFTDLYSKFDEYSDRASMVLQTQSDTFDFIIVGAGSTGAVLANRLSQHYNVLLLEAGGNPGPYNRVPLFAYLLFGKEPEDWKYKTVPQKYASFGFKENRTLWPSGRGLGGSGTINGMIYIRGIVQGYDVMAQRTGDDVWKMKNVLDYYQRMEDYDGHFDHPGSRHGKTGPFSVEKGYLSPFIDNLLRAGQELGYVIRDPNAYGPVTEGFSPMDLYIKNGRRWSTFDGYLKPILGRRSLVVRKYSNVYKVLLDDNKRATGIEYLRHGVKTVAYARKEVILSAGAIQSPKILMLSGIGPEEELAKHNIPLQVNLPVGQQLQDKYGAWLGPFLLKNGSSSTLKQIYTAGKYFDWLIGGNVGELATSSSEATYSLQSTLGRRPDFPRGVPDILTYIISFPNDRDLQNIILDGSFGWSRDSIGKYFVQAIDEETLVQFVSLAKPFGSGTIRLTDSQPLSPVLIDPEYLKDERDVRVLVEGLKFGVKLVEETKSFEEIQGRLLRTPFPGCESFVYRSDEYWECYARHATITTYKYGGTVPMGVERDQTAVVDTRLRVFQTSGLRVIDGSVLSEQYVSVNHVSCVMLGELASDFILKEYLN